MSVINQMLKDLEQRQQGGEGAVYVPPVRQQGWWMLVLTLICGLALGILGWRTWIYWQQSLVPASEPRPDAVARAVPATPAYVEQEPVDLVVALPTPGPGPETETRSLPAVEAGLAQEQDEIAYEEAPLSDEELQPELYAELEAEQEAVATPPRKPGVLKIETVNLSEAELATLAERKATTAMARGQLRDAQDNYYQVLVHDPHNQGAREQLAGLLYGEGRLSEAGQLLEEGIRLDPAQADFRLLLARLAISGGDQLKALGWLTGYQPDLASNLDYYATWAGLTQELGRNAEAAEIYVKLLRQQPDQGRWWLGLGVAEDGQGHSLRALDAYRNAQLHGNLGEASTRWIEQRIAQLAP
ncbi:tetratricopeptide repeat protein [Aeromonas salmonicida]|uniref:tetratricopeptide repeat protein n=1 Tax=Aeromonas salmonicida TaxID=645 RepID=UPI003F7C4EA1